jgi:hypothetical protein
MFNASSKLALALAVIVGISGYASAQSIVGTPMAGSAGAGNSAINGIPLGPANPGVRSDPSGVRNTVRMAAPPVAFHQRPHGAALSVISTAYARFHRMRSASISVSAEALLPPARTKLNHKLFFILVPSNAPKRLGSSCE